MDVVKLHYFNRQESDQIINLCKTERQRLINLVMLDCGVRVSEAVALRYEDFNFKSKTVKVKSLKKRDKSVYRIIPLSDRLYAQLAEYIAKRKNISPRDFLFSGQKPDTHLTRFAVNKYMSRLSKRQNIRNLHPHALRHSFATQHLSAGTPLENIKTMLGHSSYNTTLVYAHIPEQILRQNINHVTVRPVPLLTRFIRLFAPPAPVPRINIAFHTGNISIGRSNELATLVNNLNAGINTLLLGSVGVGKSHLLKQLQASEISKKILRFDDAGNIKQSLANLLLYLYKNDKQAVFNLIYPDYDPNKLIERITRDSVKNLCNQIIKITARHEYILLIDSLDNITAKAVQTLEFLKDHFIIVGAAREIKVDKSSFLWNFDILKLKNLQRLEALDLIQRLTHNLQVDDYSLFQNHIFEQTDGNPRAIYELCDRYQKEPVLSTARIRAIRHVGALKEYDCTVIILIFLASIACLRYLNHEVENNSFRFIGGAALVLLIISRYFMKSTKRKYV